MRTGDGFCAGASPTPVRRADRQQTPAALLAALDRGRLPTPTSVQAKDPKPLLMVDIDGVISLFGVPGAGAGGPFGARGPFGASGSVGASGSGDDEAVTGSLHAIEGRAHFLSHAAAAHLLELSELFELVWASGWEEKADEHLPHVLGLPADLPHLRFERGGSRVGATGAHWKLAAIERHAGARALAWVDDSFNDACHEWAAQRQAPTLLVQTEPARGLTAREASVLRSWALALGRA